MPLAENQHAVNEQAAENSAVALRAHVGREDFYVTKRPAVTIDVFQWKGCGAHQFPACDFLKVATDKNTKLI